MSAALSFTSQPHTISDFPPSSASSSSSSSQAADIHIDIPRSSKQDPNSNHKRQSSFKDDEKTFMSSAGVAHYHPRQPGPNSESYFPGFLPSQQKTPGGTIRGHSRSLSAAAAVNNPPSTIIAPMGLNLSSSGGGPTVDTAQASLGYGGGGPPSPSTLTDVILGLHSTFYSRKRKPQEVKQMVGRYYENGAVFESPLLSAHGKDQIANQFIMAFAFPGIDVESELRDVICSDFEFDGTRAGIIDHTITVTFFPSLFGSGDSSRVPTAASHTRSANVNAVPCQPLFPLTALPVTPHPFADYTTNQARFAAQVNFSSHPHSPTTPFSMGSVWGGSRPHTPGHLSSNGIRPLSGTTSNNNNTVGTAAVNASNTPPSVNGGGDSHTDAGHVAETTDLLTIHTSRPTLPAEAIRSHWSAEGLGRKTFQGIFWSLFHPRAALKSLFSIQLRVMSRLEFNDAGLIVRHQDAWSLRETIEGIVPLVSFLYRIERRIVGFFVSWAIEKGFRLSWVFSPTQADLSVEPGSGTGTDPFRFPHQDVGQGDGYDVSKSFNDKAQIYTRARDFQTISRSRATSPTYFRLSNSSTVTGTRSRARSLVGQQTPVCMRTSFSSDNLAQHFSASASVDTALAKRSMDLPPDSSVKFRERSSKRVDGIRNTNTNSSPPTTCDSNNVTPTQAASSTNVTADDRAVIEAPDQDQQ